MPYVPDRIFKTNLIGGRGGKGRLTKFETLNLIIGFPATCPPEISVSESHGALLRVLRPGWGEGPLSRRDAVAKLPILGLTCGYIRSLWTEKQKLGPTLVFWFPRGPQVPMAWLQAQKRPLSSMKCQKHCATRHETPLGTIVQA